MFYCAAGASLPVAGDQRVFLEIMTIQIQRDEGLYFRQTLFDKAKRVVVKVGSAILTDENGINREVVRNLAKEISFLHGSGREVILVTSGAVAAGKKKIGFIPHGEVSLPEKQALAAIGQSCLMQTYEEAFAGYKKNIAQILLTHSDLADRDRYLKIRNTLMTLFRFGVIPIINENDTVSVEELRFGDNDTLAALITNLIEADMFICLTDVVGLYNGNPQTDPEARPIYTVADITPEIEGMAGNVKSDAGTGGMQSKIRAAKMVAEIFEPADMDWRGLGRIPASGLKIREKYAAFDAEVRLEVTLPESREPKGCMCGNILKGMNTPKQCPLFDTRCTPANPIGPCMVSSEGTCAAYHKYGRDE